MKRAHFIAGSFALVASAQARAQELDPARTARGQELRVLLGKGQAQAIDGASFSFNGKRYRGTYSVLPDSGEVVSNVDLEQYLYSVVAREMGHSWPASALQAQAIVARTFVLQRSNPARNYDVGTSESDQVYTGMDAESDSTTAAVNSTAGQVLRFKNGFAELFYSSCCGGHTESSADAWNGPPIPYLGGVPCTYCNESPWYNWTQSIALDKVRSALGSQLADAGDLQDVQLDDVDGSGRPAYWVFTGSQGSARVKATDVRRAVGTRTVPSLLVRSAQIEGGNLTISGGGLGHGVGLCQWGARGLSLSGAGAAKILSYYFPGTVLKNV